MACHFRKIEYFLELRPPIAARSFYAPIHFAAGAENPAPGLRYVAALDAFDYLQVSSATGFDPAKLTAERVAMIIF